MAPGNTEVPPVHDVQGIGPCYEVAPQLFDGNTPPRVAFENTPMRCPFCGVPGAAINGWFFCPEGHPYVWFVPEPQRFFVPVAAVERPTGSEEESED